MARIRQITEAQFERQCSDLLALDGWRVLKTDPVSRREWGKGFGEKGMADCLYIRYQQQFDDIGWVPDIGAAEVMWIEWKVPGGKIRPEQNAWRLAERARGALALMAGIDFPATWEGFTAWYRTSGLMRRAGLC